MSDKCRVCIIQEVKLLLGYLKLELIYKMHSVMIWWYECEIVNYKALSNSAQLQNSNNNINYLIIKNTSFSKLHEELLALLLIIHAFLMSEYFS